MERSLTAARDILEPIDFTTYIMLSLLVAAWCVLHSAMISITVTEYLRKHLGQAFRFYRLFFNLISFLTLIPVALFAYSIKTQPVFQWDGYLRLGQILIIGTAILLFYLGGRNYDPLVLLGIKQIRAGAANKALTDSGDLDTSGILSITRHPWYLAAILIIWARQLDVSAIIVNVIFTSYLVVGTYLEEKKLVKEFGEKYLAYQKKVSMLVPYKWLKAKIRK